MSRVSRARASAARVSRGWSLGAKGLVESPRVQFGIEEAAVEVDVRCDHRPHVA
jgi:hypothetical protein